MNNTNSKKGIVIWVAVIIVIILVVGGYMLGSRNQKKSDAALATSDMQTLRATSTPVAAKPVQATTLIVAPIVSQIGRTLSGGQCSIPGLHNEGSGGDIRIDSFQIQKVGSLSNHYLTEYDFGE